MGPDGFGAGDTWPARSGAELFSEGAAAPAHGGLDPERGRYVEGGLLGRGGMGEVVSARDLRLDREVALKRARVDDAALVREARFTARLAHPGIVPVYEAGWGEDGKPYYTMPVLRGRSLAEALREARTLPERLRRLRHVLDAARALSYAHSQGVLHRDIKPANLMVGEFGETRVADWGLAVEAAGAHGGVGTPEYAAPEQRAGGPIDQRAEVYAMGSVLFELLAGHPPRRGPGAPLEALPAEAPPELAAIVRKAMEDEPAARYPDLAAFAEELEAWFEGRRVQAHAYSTWELLRRLLVVWRLPLAVGGVAALAVAASLALGYMRTAVERDRARQAEQVALTTQREAERSLGRALVAQALEAAARGERAEAEVLASGALLIQESPDARGVLARFGGRERPERVFSFPLPHCDRVSMSRDTREVACASSEGLLRLDPERGARVRYPIVASYMAFLGEDLALSTAEGLVWLGDARGELRSIPDDKPGNQRPVGGWPGVVVMGGSGGTTLLGTDGSRQHINLGRTPVARAYDDGRVIMATDDGHVELWTREGGTRRVSGGPLHPMSLALASDGSDRGLVGAVDGNTWLVDFDTGRWERLGEGLPDAHSDLALYGDLVALAPSTGGAMVWDLRRKLWVARLPSGVAAVGFKDQGRVLRVASDAVEDWRLPLELWPHLHEMGAGVGALDLSPDGRLLAVGLGSGATSLVSLEDGLRVADLSWQQAVVKDLAFSPDGALLAVGTAGPAGARVFDVALRQLRHTFEGAAVRRLSWLGLDKLVFVRYTKELDLASLAPGAQVQALATALAVGDLDPVPGGEAAWALDQLGGVHRVEASGVTPRFGLAGGFSLAALGEDRLVVAYPDRLALHGPGGEEEAAAEGFDARALEVAASPDGRFVALGHLDGTVTVWSARDLRRLAVLRGHGGRVVALSFSQDGRWLATGGWDGQVRLWALSPLTMPAEALSHLTARAWGRGVDEILAR